MHSPIALLRVTWVQGEKSPIGRKIFIANNPATERQLSFILKLIISGVVAENMEHCVPPLKKIVCRKIVRKIFVVAFFGPKVLNSGLKTLILGQFKGKIIFLQIVSTRNLICQKCVVVCRN